MSSPFFNLTVYDHADVESALARDLPKELQRVCIAVALADDDYHYAVGLCLLLSHHADPTVAGNALLGLGHLARRFGQLPHEARRLVEAGLAAADGHVRAQAESAADDVAMFAPSDD